MPPEHSRGWPRPAHLVCLSFHHCGFSQSLLDAQFSPWALSHQSVCLCLSTPLLLPVCCLSPHRQVVRSRYHPAPSWDEASWNFFREALYRRCGSHLSLGFRW